MSSTISNPFDDLISNESRLTPINKTADVVRNLYDFKNDDGEDLILCHVPLFAPFSILRQGFSLSSGALMAMHHWNTGNGVIVKEIGEMYDTCPIRFTTEVFDTEQSPRNAMGGMIDLVSRKSGDDEFLKPCAIVGPVYSDVSTKFAMLSGLYDVLNVSPSASSPKLEDKKLYPLFARTVPSKGTSAGQAVDYLHDYLGVKNFAVVYSNDDYGIEYNKLVIKRATEKSMESPLSVPVKILGITKDRAKESLREIKKQKIKYMIGAFFNGPFDALMEAAYDLGIAGPGNLWLFCDEMGYFIYFNSKVYEKGSALAKAVYGNAVMVDTGGVPGIPQYDAFFNEWKRLGEENATIHYIASKHKDRINGDYTMEEYHDALRNEFSKIPVNYVIYSYEAIVAIGISACKALGTPGQESSSLFTSMDHHKQLLDIDFQSASGNFTIAPGTISRDSSNVMYSMANILGRSENSTTRTTLKGVVKSYFDNKKKVWVPLEAADDFIYSDGSRRQPQEYAPPDNVALLLSFIAGFFVILAVLGYMGFHRIRKYNLPAVRLVSNGEIPNTTLSEYHINHLFVSHVWSTGQAKTHAVVRKLQLYLPGIKIWLDVDVLDDLYNLEASIETSLVFILFYSPGYFASKNCRRELYKAVKLNKPIIVLYEGSESTIDTLKRECIEECLQDGNDNDSPSPEIILKKILGDDNADNCILWLNEGSFSSASLNRIYLSLLKYFPYYQKHPSQLRAGLAVPKEQVPVSLQSPVNVLFQTRKYNEHFSYEMQAVLSSFSESGVLSIIDTDTFIPQYFHHVGQNDHSEGVEIEVGDEQSSISDDHNFNNRPSFFILYLNRETFEFDTPDEERDFINVLKYCTDKFIKILLVHEMDISKGACSFDYFREIAPNEVSSPPIDIFNDIATPLYAHPQYREVSMKSILLKMGGEPVKHRSRKWRLVQRLGNAINSNAESFSRRRL